MQDMSALRVNLSPLKSNVDPAFKARKDQHLTLREGRSTFNFKGRKDQHLTLREGTINI